MAIVNWALIREPLNWATVVVVCLFGLALLAIVAPEPDDA